MNVSYQWLRSIAPSLTAAPREVADSLAMLGAPVDEVLELAEGIRDVLIARVEEVRQHPNADRLRICSVDAGGPERLQVVCGAPNVEAGGFYPFAPVGAHLPGGVEIRKAKLRGESSEGMLCSARELGLGRDHAGLLALAGEWEPGSSFVDHLGLDDARLVVDVTPNRPDLLSHLGIAREVAPLGAAAITLSPFSAPEPVLELQSAAGDGSVPGLRVVLEDATGCTRYLAAVIRGVRVHPSPEWLATRLRSVGLRPINNVVDATNYVLHELGQPLHGFDLDTITGGEIRVRRARDGETLRTLDGVDRSLDADALVIADAERPVALAGIMGGQETEVTDATTNVLIECALFEPTRVRRGARALALSTDASYRFERGVDPELQPLALRRVVDLIVSVAGGVADGVLLEVVSTAPQARRTVDLRPARVASVLGVEISADEIAALLGPIGFDVASAEGALQVRVPGFRPDVTREIDLIEEIARRRGYDSFPEEMRPFRPGTVPQDPLVGVQRRVRELFTRWGFLEARSAGFAPAAEHRVPLLNPLSAEESHLRDSLLPGLLRRLEHNWAHGVRSIRLYEIGTVFSPSPGEGLPREEIRVAAVVTGSSEPPHWSGPDRATDLWDLKALLTELARELGSPPPEPGGIAEGPVELVAAESFRIGPIGTPVGRGGLVDASAFDPPAWAEPVFALEATLAPTAARVPWQIAPLPQFPAVDRDLALLVPVATTAGAVEAAVLESGGTLLEAVWPFDLYAGAGIPEGTRSLAWRLRFRHPERTLTDGEVDRALDAVLGHLGSHLGVVRR